MNECPVYGYNCCYMLTDMQAERGLERKKDQEHLMWGDLAINSRKGSI